MKLSQALNSLLVMVPETDGSPQVISIRNTGIPNICIANLCHPFRRMENVLSRRHQGNGMGLFITKALVERGQGGEEAGRSAANGRTLTNKERAKAKYWRDKMAAADVNDVRDLPRAGKLTDEEVAMINASYQRAIAVEWMRLSVPAVGHVSFSELVAR
jgi:hypothetical protein